jgi:uncharacterized protein
MQPETATIEVAPGETITRLHYRADPSVGTLILAHGAGADQRHKFMVAISSALAKRGLDVFTFNFLYTEKKKKAPDRNDALEACWRAVIAQTPGKNVFAGGKSMGGRIASQVLAKDPSCAEGLVFLGYPLHPPGKPDTLRTAHWPKIKVRSLFVQGTRDPFGSPDELMPHLKRLGAKATVVPVLGGDHSFNVPKKGPVTQDEVMTYIEDAVLDFVTKA